MAKGSRRRQEDEDVGLNEVDAFSANREKVLLEAAGEYGRVRSDEDEDSEEEVMDIGDDDGEEEDDDDNEVSDVDEHVEEEEEEGWGGKKNYYGGEEDSDIEDQRLMTEEAIKQQKKHLKDLAMDDYVDEDMLEGWKKTTQDFESSGGSGVAQLVTTTDGGRSLNSLDDNDRLTILNTSFPEFIPLLKELTQLQAVLKQLDGKEQTEFVVVKRVALSAYLGAIASYFALFSEQLKTDESFVTMKDNAVMETILSAREVWRQAGELPDEATTKVSEDDKFEDAVDSNDVDATSESDIMDAEVNDATSSEEEVEDEDEDEDEDENEDFDIDVSAKRTIKTNGRKGATNDFVEDAVDEVDLEEKKRRKKSLRFYTSKIDQAAAKTDRYERFTGDLDLPYQERLFERQQRLIEEARKRGLGQDKDQFGDNLSDNEHGSEDEATANRVNESMTDDYYNAIKHQKQAKKEGRKQAHSEAVKAAREGKLAELLENMGEDGKRAINFQILKNKGLTPKRKKENRNSRVKKRNKYEKAKKKLRSVRQVYSEPKGPYGGEKTGIKKGLSRSVKLV